MASASAAGSWTATASEVDIGGKLPPGATEGVEQSVLKPRVVCYDPRSTRSLLEEFAGAACTAERAGVDGQRFSGKMICADDKTYGSTSYDGTFDQTTADVDLTVDMAFKEFEWRMFISTHVKFEWQGERCETQN